MQWFTVVEKLTVIQQLKQILAFYGAQTFITPHSANILMNINIFFKCVDIKMARI
jgi:hypothetical protein